MYKKTVRNHDAAPLMFPLLARVVFFVRCAPGCRVGINWRLVPGSRGTFSWNNCAGVHCEVVHIHQMSDARIRAWMMTAEMCVRHRSMTCPFAALGWGAGAVGIYKPRVCLWTSRWVFCYEMFVAPSGKNIRTRLILTVWSNSLLSTHLPCKTCM